VSTNSFVLLCAEEDDLALVQWVHAARERGLAPEIVTGVEVDDTPLREALADPDSRLFVVLRSDSLDAVRMREIKAAFAKYRSPRQRLFAMRVDYSAEVAIDRIVAELDDKPRARSESSMVLAFEDVTGPHRVVRTATVTGSVPTVDGALRLIERVTEHEVTERVDLDLGPGSPPERQETIPMIVAPPSASPTATKPRRGWARAAAWIGGLGLAAAASGVAVIGATAEPDTAVRPGAAAPADGTRVTAPPRSTAGADSADPEAPAVLRIADERREPEPTTPHRSPKRRAHDRSADHRVSDAHVAAPSVEPAPAAVVDATAPAAAPLEPAPLEPAPLEPAPLEPLPKPVAAAEPAAAPG
jgi:hypothetical protein